MRQVVDLSVRALGNKKMILRTITEHLDRLIKRGHVAKIKIIIAQLREILQNNVFANLLNELLISAAIYNKCKIIEYLKDQGADVNFQDGEMSTPLHYAARLGRVEAVSTLLSLGAKVDIKNFCGSTALFDAINCIMPGYKECVELLIRARSDVNTMNNYQETPLHCAVGCAKVDIVELLLSHKANPMSKSRRSISWMQTPLELAKSEISDLQQYNPERIERIKSLEFIIKILSSTNTGKSSVTIYCDDTTPKKISIIPLL